MSDKPKIQDPVYGTISESKYPACDPEDRITSQLVEVFRERDRLKARVAELETSTKILDAAMTIVYADRDKLLAALRPVAGLMATVLRDNPDAATLRVVLMRREAEAAVDAVERR